MCHSHWSFRPLFISNFWGTGVNPGKRGIGDSLVDLSMELVESIVHSFDLSRYSVINSLSSEWPVVTGENLDIEVD